MKKAIITILITIVILVVLSCVCIFSIPFVFFINNLAGALIPPPDLKRYVIQDELIGVWILNSYTESIISRDKPSGTRPLKCHLTLNKDGTCEFDSVYGSYDSFAYRKSKGSWVLEHNTMGDSNIRKMNAIALICSQFMYHMLLESYQRFV